MLKLDYEINKKDVVLGPIHNRVITQKLPCKNNNLSKIVLYGATYNRINTCRIKITLCIKGITIRIIEETCNTLKDNSLWGFSFEPITDSSGKEYEVYVETIGGSARNCITLYGGADKTTFFIQSYYEEKLKLKLVLIYSNKLCSCTKKYTFEYERGLRKFFYTKIIYYSDLKESDFEENDIFFFQRIGANGEIINEYYKYKLLDYIKRYNHKITIYHIDDFVLNSQNNLPLDFIDAVNLVFVPNINYKHILKKEYHNKLKVLRTFIDINEIKSIEVKNEVHDKTRIIWVSNNGLGNSFMNILIPELSKLDCFFYFIGDSIKLNKSNNLKIFPILEYNNLIRYIKNCDIMVNPLDYISNFRGEIGLEYLNCKSEIKYLIAAACRKPFITSKNLSMLYAVKNNINGYILENNIEVWKNIVIQIKHNKIKTNRMVDIAYDDVLNNYTVEVAAENFYNLIEDYLCKK